MVTLASRANDWNRASYLDLEGAPKAPQAIGALLPQVLARYALPPIHSNNAEAMVEPPVVTQHSTRLVQQSA